MVNKKHIDRKRFYELAKKYKILDQRLTQPEVNVIESFLDELEGINQKRIDLISKVSDRGIALIKQFEGFSSKPYKDPIGIPTIGYGTIRYPNGVKVKMSDSSISESQAISYLKHHVESYADAVDDLTINTINQNQFDALVSFAYNLGPTAYKKSTLRRYVNANPNDPNIRKQFMRWVYAGGRKFKGLERRRKAEADLYFSPIK